MCIYDVVLSPEFLNELDEIIGYYSVYSEDYVIDIINEIIKISRLVSRFPYLAPVFKTNIKIRNIIIKNRYILLYRINVDKIEFVHFLDGRMQNNSLEVNETAELIYAV